MLKGAGPGQSGGGDTPNEDEYSAALERLLEGCPAALAALPVKLVAQRGGMEGDGSGAVVLWGRSRLDDWDGRQAREGMSACVLIDVNVSVYCNVRRMKVKEGFSTLSFHYIECSQNSY